MSQHQQHLLNTASMSSAREMRKLRRDREVQRLRLQRRTKTEFMKPDNRSWDGKQEFAFKDEDRDWRLRIAPCPVCETPEPYMRTTYDVDPNSTAKVFTKRFQIYCRNHQGAPGVDGCPHRTPVMNSANDAIRHWKLVAALSK